MKVNYPDSFAHQGLKIPNQAGAADPLYDRLRPAEPAWTPNQAPNIQQTDLRLAAEMEAGRGRNIYTLA